MRILQLAAFIAFVTSWQAGLLRADQVVMQNGDIYNGTVLSVTTGELVLNNENLGKISIPRSKVAAINFAQKPSTPARQLTSSLSSPSPTNVAPDLDGMLRGIKYDTNLVQQVQAQILGAADPKATANFSQMLDDLSTGKMDLKSLRAQAQSTADQLQDLKKGLGPDAGDEIDGYLAILTNFLQETAPPAAQ